jgi:hypothetical protein
MRRSGWFLVLVLLCAVSGAQMPPRAQLVRTPKFVASVKADFRTFTEQQLRKEIAIVSARSYAVFGYNTPEVRIKLPQVSNSAYASIELADPTVLNEAGQPVTFEVEHGGYNEEKFSDEIRFASGTDEVVRYASARGTVKVKYPLEVKTLKLTPAQLGPKDLAMKISGPYVSFDDEAVQVPETSFTKLKPIRAYDAAGHQLEEYSQSETSTDADGVMRKKMAFYGVVARVEIDSVPAWAEFELTYDLKPAPLLPAGHEGEDPESYQQ